ncbi:MULTISPECIES: AAA family ATPase [Micrococcaceae]|uniref:Translation-disabling ACNase RloC n=1 Tax=Arthrobacter rhombi TaxID=71253 RepID=A0A1R4FMR9_9MICC|nr:MULTISPECIES: AAA family ATPase [Micrococcaceae]SJM57042.1 Translation-disabling ACNase RloC [Arthrobacter rhombi]
MIQHIAHVENFRTLAQSPHVGGDQSYFGAYTLIFGANGSGKSTISELLRQLGTVGAPSKTTLVTDTDTQRLTQGAPFESHRVWVFNSDFVHENLREFVSGSGPTAPIIKLGKVAVDDEAESRLLAKLVARNDIWKAGLESDQLAGIANRKKAISATKELVIEFLGTYDGARFNSNSFTTTKARALLDNPRAVRLSRETARQHMRTLSQAALEAISPPSMPLVDVRDFTNRARLIIARRQSESEFPELDGDLALAAWVQSGIAHHENNDDCKFCGSDMPESLLVRLTTYFKNGNAQIRADAEALASSCADASHALDQWIRELSAPSGIIAAESEKWASAVDSAKAFVVETTASLREIQSACETKATNLSYDESLASPNMRSQDFLAELAACVERHETERTDYSAVQNKAVDELALHAAAFHQSDLTAAENRLARVASALELVNAQSESCASKLKAIEARRLNTSEMAAQLTDDLHTIFGKTTLTIQPTSDGSGYQAVREDGPAKFLSEGEQRILALVYFIRTLDDDNFDRKNATVVIDDPSTSLDRENVFATSAWLDQQLDGVRQRILLTHSFDFFQLQLRAQNSNENDEPDAPDGAGTVPAHRVLEIRSSQIVGADSNEITIRAFPEKILSAPSEYVYLFRRVAEACAGLDDENLPVVGNAARRLIEGFLAFKAPQASNFGSRFALCIPTGISSGVANQVKTFLHNQSHRSAPDPSSTGVEMALLPSVKGVMAFMRACDETHFTGLAKAVGIDPKDILTGRDLAAARGQIKT